jgi:hypothetical protein
LGLEAQKQAVTDFLNGGSWEIAAEFTKVESGKDDTNRPQLAKAFAAGRAHGARYRADSLRCRLGRASGGKRRSRQFLRVLSSAAPHAR